MSRVLPVPPKSDTYAFLTPKRTSEGSDLEEKGVLEGNKASPENPINPVETAYAWHGGQWSPLYSFASTGGRVHGEEHRQALVGEIRTCLRFAEERQMTDEVRNLNELLACVGGKEDDSE